MSEEAKPVKKKGKSKLFIVIGVVLLIGIGGAAGGFYAAGAFTKKDDAVKEDPNKPVLVPKGQTAEDVAAEHGAGEGEHAEAETAGHGDKPSKGIDLPTPKNTSAYQATYYQIPQPFTSNMVDTDSYAQISIAVGTYYDARVTQALQTHEMAIRSAILLLLAEQQEMQLATPAGKEALQSKLRDTVNSVLKQKTGYGGVDNVYFTNFVIQ